MEIALDRWPKHLLKPHIVADSAFGGIKMMKRIREWGGTATIALNPTYQKKITELITQNLAPRSYRTIAKDGIVLSTSSMVSETGAMVFKHILCVGAKYEVKKLPTSLEIRLNSTSLKSRAELEKMKIAELDKLATDLKFPVKREKKELKIDRILKCYGETCNRILELSPVAAFFHKSFSKGIPAV